MNNFLKFFSQSGGGKCSLCGSPGTTKTTCPLNPDATNPNPKKHPLALKSGTKQSNGNYKKTKKAKSKSPKSVKMSSSGFNVGDFVAGKSWGRNESWDWKIGKIIKITPASKIRIALLPTTRGKDIPTDDEWVNKWEEIVTDTDPSVKDTILVGSDGVYGKIKFEKISEERLNQPFINSYDSYS